MSALFDLPQRDQHQRDQHERQQDGSRGSAERLLAGLNPQQRDAVTASVLILTPEAFARMAPDASVSSRPRSGA